MKDILEKINLDTYIVSDLHLGHKTILDFEPTRFGQMKKDGFINHEEWLIHRWNSVVSDDDTVLCLGDFAFNNIDGYSKMLKGNKILILGNHDSRTFKNKTKEWHVIDGMFIHKKNFIYKVLNDDVMFSCIIKELGNSRILFSHYPVYNDNDIYQHRDEKIKKRIETFNELFIKESCDLNIHGHLHSGTNSFFYSKSASIENTNFQPIQLRELLKLQ